MIQILVVLTLVLVQVDMIGLRFLNLIPLYSMYHTCAFILAVATINQNKINNNNNTNAALYALAKVTRIVFKVIVIELFLILSFSAMACHLYFEFDAFRDLSSSFLS